MCYNMSAREHIFHVMQDFWGYFHRQREESYKDLNQAHCVCWRLSVSSCRSGWSLCCHCWFLLLVRCAILVKLGTNSLGVLGVLGGVFSWLGWALITFIKHFAFDLFDRCYINKVCLINLLIDWLIDWLLRRLGLSSFILIGKVKHHHRIWPRIF